MLRETAGASYVFNAFVAAEQGDYGGLAALSRGYDLEIAKQLEDQHGEYYGEFFCKVMSSGLNATRDYLREMDPPTSLLGSPAAKLLWGAASANGWPVKAIAPKYRPAHLHIGEDMTRDGTLERLLDRALGLMDDRLTERLVAATRRLRIGGVAADTE
jgi:hypothetical protein